MRQEQDQAQRLGKGGRETGNRQSSGEREEIWDKEGREETEEGE